MWQSRDMAARDGDGWIQCQCGSKHWGKFGAAGILIFRDSADGKREIFLQHRAPWVHNGDTWGIPGGARDSHETVTEAALREACEETGIKSEHLTPLALFSDDHGDWRYDTVLAAAAPEMSADSPNDESQEMRWVAVNEVTLLGLHPSFAKTWSDLRTVLETL
jgi:8-oxo-dGTP diphosphatase